MKKGIELAIKKAIEEGYYIITNTTGRMYSKSDTDILLDKDFWQALGKAEGWNENVPSAVIYKYKEHEWLGYWHKFIDHLAEGKDINSFFEELWQKKCSHGITANYCTIKDCPHFGVEFTLQRNETRNIQNHRQFSNRSQRQIRQGKKP